MRAIRLMAAAVVLMMCVPAVGFAQDEEAYDELVKATRYAGAGSLTRSVKHFERVLELAPEAYPLAYFNLAEVYKAKKKCGKAVILYEAYARKVGTPEGRAEADKAIAGCPRATAVLALSIAPAKDNQVILNGYSLAVGEGGVTLKVVPGTYALEVSATDHVAFKKKLEVGKDGAKQAVKLELQTFQGKVVVSCETPGAKVRVFEGPSDKTKVLHQGGPLAEPMELTEGKHFVEVTAPGHDRWVRNVRISRDETTEVKVILSKERPPELN